MLIGLKAEYTTVDVDLLDDGDAIRTEVYKITGQTSVPYLFIGGEFCGGANDGGLGGTFPLHKSGELRRLLIAAGALKP